MRVTPLKGLIHKISPLLLHGGKRINTFCNSIMRLIKNWVIV